MSLIPDGRAALIAILDHPDLFSRVKPGDLASAATKLARKQLTAAGQGLADLHKLKETLGEDVFEKSLDSLSPHHLKQLARRLDKGAPEIEINTGSSALSHIRALMRGTVSPSEAAEPAATAPEEAPAAAPKNKYLGRKAFRTGR